MYFLAVKFGKSKSSHSLKTEGEKIVITCEKFGILHPKSFSMLMLCTYVIVNVMYICCCTLIFFQGKFLSRNRSVKINSFILYLVVFKKKHVLNLMVLSFNDSTSNFFFVLAYWLDFRIYCREHNIFSWILF